jgi:hypothetical protein
MYFVPKDMERFLWDIEMLWDNFIVQQKFAGGYEGYHEEYKRWKAEAFRAPNKYWKLGGDFLKAIDVWPLMPSQMSGVGARSSGKGWKGAMHGARMAGAGGRGRSGAYLGGPKRRAYVVGVKGGKVDTGFKSWFGKAGDLWGPPKLISMYAHVMEFGGDYTARRGGRHPARPVFAPTLVGYSRSEGLQLSIRTLKAVARKSWR